MRTNKDKEIDYIMRFLDLRDFPPESRSPQTVHEGTGTFLACQPPAHYPGVPANYHNTQSKTSLVIYFLPMLKWPFRPPALSYRWFINEFPSFIQPEDGRWFVSQVTGNLYLANARANDTGNYFCFTTINMDISTKSIFSKAVQLTVYSDGQCQAPYCPYWAETHFNALLKFHLLTLEYHLKHLYSLANRFPSKLVVQYL